MKNTILQLLERYVEFLVLAAVLVVLGLYLAMQFVGDPNAGKGGIGPAEVNSILQDKATALKRSLEREGVGGLHGKVVPDPPDLLDRYQTLAGASVLPPRYQSFAVASRGPIDEDGGEASEELTEVHVPTIPSPEQILVYQSFDTITESAVSELESLSNRFESAPFDVSWLTISAKFNIDEVLSRFQSKGDEGQRAMSERWYNGRIDVLDIVVERREVHVDGTKSEPEQIQLLPGQLSFRERIEGDVSAGERDGILSDLRSGVSQQMVVQPEFLPTKFGLWDDPEEAADKLSRGGDEDPLERLQRLIERRRKLQEELDRIGGGGPDGGPGGGPGGIGGGGGGMGGPGGIGGGGGMGGPGGGGGMGGPGGGAPGGSGGDDRDRLIKRLQQQIRRMTNEIKRLARVVNWTDEQIEEYEPGEPAEAAAFELSGTLQIWAHDLQVQPDETYEYRISAAVYNPLFAKSLNLPESQRALAEDVSLASLPGEWSDPIRVERPTRAYVMRARAPGQGRGLAGPLDLGIAQVKTYRFYNGKWHVSRQSIQPGDTVGMVEKDEGDGTLMDFATGRYVVDIIADLLASDEYAGSGRGAFVLFGQEGFDGLIDIRSPLIDREAIKPWIDEEPDEDGMGG
ncbi:MAG: hypothetical protein QF471_08680 [Phycisphaerales bacterium]|nr:hypothetical protein [Phycisphaerales bacterium]